MKKNKEVILITGTAGFVGFHFAKKLLEKNLKVIGIDNLNNYYDNKIKKDRLKILKSKNFIFFKEDLTKKKIIIDIFKKFKPKYIFHFAAQAGVRHSFVDPDSYFNNNMKATYNILEAAKLVKSKNFFFASTSSIYGSNSKKKFKESDCSTKPIQLYAATKSACEVIAHSYSSNYNLNVMIFRFFTVYGPWGRPDMALFKFVKNILENKKIEVYNNGNHKRDFTYVEDLVECMVKIFEYEKKLKNTSSYKTLNIGAGKQESLKKYIGLIENYLKRKSKKKLLPLQRGDIKNTFADNNELKKLIGNYKFTSVKIGIEKFIDWYKGYYSIK